MTTNNKNPLTGGMMIIVMPGRKGKFSMGDYLQQTTQQIIRINQDTIDTWSHKALPDEIGYSRQPNGEFKTVSKLRHPIERRMEYWLNDHFLSIVGSHQLNFKNCSWSFKHDQF